MNKNTTKETVEEFIARGGKVQEIASNDSAHKRMNKLKRVHARLVKNDETNMAKLVQTKINKYKTALSWR